MKLLKNLINSLALAVCFSIAGNFCGNAQTASDTSKSTAALLGAFQESAKSAADPEVKSLGAELGTKVGNLNNSLGDHPEAQGHLQKALEGLSGKGSPGSTVMSLQQLSQSKLTPEQMTLAKDVYHTGSAYLVQKNLGSLEGSQGDVAQVVSSLKKGKPVEALVPLKNIGQNAKLTEPQKAFLSSLTKSYTPGVQKADDLLKGIPGLGK